MGIIIDLVIVAFAISALYRGREIGFVRQLFSTAGFFGGLFLGAWLQKYTVSAAHGQDLRSAITLFTTLGCAFIFLTIGEYIGLKLKGRVLLKRTNVLDNGFGGLLSVVALLLTIWLTAAILSGLPLPGVQSALKNSRIVSSLNRALPSAPSVISRLGQLVDPNGFPQVFTDGEPSPREDVNLPSLGELQAAVDRDKASVVKVEGQGCGGVVEGSGFVVGSNLVATNAHVIAGIPHPYVQDANGTHGATPIWFDARLDFAVLRVSNLAGHSLVIANQAVAVGTPGAVLGYPGGGPLVVGPAAISNHFVASGRDIYGRGHSDRDVYELRAKVRSGNSGGPVIAKDGSVIGVIFAESSNYEDVGYALTSGQVSDAIHQAVARNQAASTGRCAE
ncbi:MAG TPA: MarP family serine protease [Candidatus Saccharimonadales bacterium]|nr:MarP family serine protease [Candidatus Saccharimonadales bacterium]